MYACVLRYVAIAAFFFRAVVLIASISRTSGHQPVAFIVLSMLLLTTTTVMQMSPPQEAIRKTMKMRILRLKKSLYQLPTTW